MTIHILSFPHDSLFTLSTHEIFVEDYFINSKTNASVIAENIGRCSVIFLIEENIKNYNNKYLYSAMSCVTQKTIHKISC